MSRVARAMVACGLAALLAGCARYSEVRLVAPEGAKLILVQDELEYAFPSMVKFRQRDSASRLHEDAGGREIHMLLPNGTRLRGYLSVYRISMGQTERLAEVPFLLTDEQLGKLKDGYAVSVFGYTARSRPVYKVVLGLDRES